MTESRLQQWRAITKAATPGPWGVLPEADRRFVNTARTAMPLLLDLAAAAGEIRSYLYQQWINHLDDDGWRALNHLDDAWDALQQEGEA
jgi:hypothetical protein